jgi:hypothetical protein
MCILHPVSPISYYQSYVDENGVCTVLCVMILYVLYMNDDKQDGKSRRKNLQLHIIHYILYFFIFLSQS